MNRGRHKEKPKNLLHGKSLTYPVQLTKRKRRYASK
uniref:Uncharacterized protein n=1 Tax=Utricularia reniformis TaxID=192314 RepID=A0A1Y0B2S9_9LAMI|nr:hypothetical protein AEK19_MT1511 [Utricularia reniformis]ART31701.1 hypothetical protein AEK19_MT1511 [Utricularia reniformis]